VVQLAHLRIERRTDGRRRGAARILPVLWAFARIGGERAGGKNFAPAAACS
jgi:hypothetical protein